MIVSGPIGDAIEVLAGAELLWAVGYSKSPRKISGSLVTVDLRGIFFVLKFPDAGPKETAFA